jgi:hypothetical protein
MNNDMITLQKMLSVKHCLTGFSSTATIAGYLTVRF